MPRELSRDTSRTVAATVTLHGLRVCHLDGVTSETPLGGQLRAVATGSSVTA
jgi:hypothetical protein